MVCYSASKPICPTPHEVGIAALKRKRRHAASAPLRFVPGLIDLPLLRCVTAVNREVTNNVLNTTFRLIIRNGASRRRPQRTGGTLSVIFRETFDGQLE